MENKLTHSENRDVEVVKQGRWNSPDVDVFENDQELLLYVDLPGVERDHLRIDVENKQITIEGRQRIEKLGAAIGREAGEWDYYRNFAMPHGIDTQKIVADLKHGVLMLHLPKVDSLKPRRIDVKPG